MSLYNVIVGLGNPGKKYESTRHNIGFMLVEEFFRNNGASESDWKDEHEAAVVKTQIAGEKTFGVKPLSYMNLSGKPLQKVLHYYKLEVEKTVVVHDDIDLPLGTFRFKIGGGDGGHNGIKSISRELGTNDFLRLKVGVGRPDDSNAPEGSNQQMEVSSWVLQRFRDTEAVNKILDAGSRALDTLVASGIKEAQNRFNGSVL